MNSFKSLLSVALIGIAFSSCKKDNIDAPVIVPPAGSSIEAVLKFNGNLSDSINKLLSPSLTGTLNYAADRNGNANSALYLDGASSVTFPGLNVKGKSFSMTAWVKYFNLGGGLTHLVTAMDDVEGGVTLYQQSDHYGSSVSVTNTNSADGIVADNKWHHLAVTYDGTDIKFYTDGLLSSTINHPGSIGNTTRNLGFGSFHGSFWKGYIDDVRVYSKVLVLSDIQQLTAL